MANKFTNPQYYTDIANAIRTINGLSRTYTPPQMAQAILDLNISTGEAPELTGLTIVTPPNKTIFGVGETFHLNGIKLKASYSGGYYRWLTANDITTNLGYNYTFTTSDVGTKTITITYRDEWDNIANVTLGISIIVIVYGAEWDGSSTTKWTRTDQAADFEDPTPAINNGTGSSPFDNIAPWSEMTIVEDSAGGTLVKIPKFYYKWTRNGDAMKLQITTTNTSGFSVSPAHMNRGDGKGERDVIYVGRYHCASDYKSKTGVTPEGNHTRAEFRTSIHNLGSTIWQNDIALFWTIRMLYLVEYADWNAQAVIGYGCSPSSSLGNMGGTDSMQYHTGTSAANRTTYGWTQYRNIEGLWDNVYDWCDGIYFNGNSIYGILNPANFSDTANGTLAGTRLTTGGNSITKWNTPSATDYTWLLFPSQTTSGTNTYISDGYLVNGYGVTLLVGGNYSMTTSDGLFYLNCGNQASTKNAAYGSRIMKLP